MEFGLIRITQAGRSVLRYNVRVDQLVLREEQKMEPISFTMTPEAISALVGFVLMLVFAYFPGLRVSYGALASEVKSYIMVGLLVLATIIIWVLTLNGIIVSPEPVSVNTLLNIIFALLVANQPTYAIAPEAADVKAAKLARDSVG
jgi:hypothetical protein